MTTTSKSNRVSAVTQLITGTNKHFPNASQSLAFGGTTRTVSALTQLLQSIVDLRNAVIESQAATRSKVATERAQTPPLLAVRGEYEAFVRATFGNQPDVLADFGLAPRKVPAPRTAEQKAIATAKRNATRKARGTKSKKQLKDVKGAVSAELVVTPLAAPSPVVPPAPTASGGGQGVTKQ